MPKLTPAVTKARAAKLVKTLQNKDFNQAAVARELGVSRQAIQDKMKQPEVQKTLEQVIADNFKKADITIEKVYSVLAAGLDAKKDGNIDYKECREAVKLCLELIGHLKRDRIEEARPTEIHVHYGHRTKPQVQDQQEEGT